VQPVQVVEAPLPNLKEVLADPKFTDDTKITIPNVGEITLGELRGMDQERTTGLTAREARLKEQEEQLQRSAADVANLYAALPQNQPDYRPPAPNAPPPAPKTEVDENDLYMGPLVRHFKSEFAKQQAAMEANNRILAAHNNYLRGLAEAHTNDLSEVIYDTLPEKPEGYDAGRLRQYAMEQGLKRPNGLPDVRAAAEKLLAPVRLKRTEDEAYKRGLEAGQRKATQEARAPRPTSAGIGPRPGKDSPKSLDEALRAAWGDEEIPMSNILPQ
jgi:hypothetical protein